MLRAIFEGLRNAMRYAFGIGMFFITWPFRLFAPRQRAPLPSVDIAALKDRLAGPGLKPAELVQSRLRDAAVAWSHINGSMIDRQTRPFPSALSKTMCGWLQGLTFKQLNLLKEAGAMGIFQHAFGKKLITFVPALGPLTPVNVIYPPAPKVANPDGPRLIRQTG
jgi:hypothetical protein